MEKLTESEELVMVIAWNAEDVTLPVIEKDINARFNKDWKPQTVSTFLARLCRKDFLKLHRKGRYFYYEILVNREDYRKREIEAILELLYNNETDLFKEELKELGI